MFFIVHCILIVRGDRVPANCTVLVPLSVVLCGQSSACLPYNVVYIRTVRTSACFFSRRRAGPRDQPHDDFGRDPLWPTRILVFCRVQSDRELFYRPR